MQLSDQEKIKLRTILTDTNLYERAKTQVLLSYDAQVLGSSREPMNLALDLAIEKGVHLAFERLELILQPKPEAKTPISPKSILRTTLTQKR